MTAQAMLPRAVRGGLRPSPLITWLREDGTPEDLSGATLSGTITSGAAVERPIAGSLQVVSGPAGTFVWNFAAEDVAEAGTFEVRFTAAFGTPPSPAKTFAESWKVVK